MTQQPDAMRLADKLEDVALNAYVIEPAVAELRRLYAVNAQLLKALEDIASTDLVDAALDPDKAQRIASVAIAAAKGEA